MKEKLIDYEGFEAYAKGVREKYADKKDIPTSLSKLQEDSTHQTVTATDKTKWDKVTDKVDKVEGKQLSSNDYTDEDKQKVGQIPDNPKYTDTIPDLSGYATKESVPTKIADLQEDTTHRTVTDTEKTAINNSFSKFKELRYPGDGHMEFIFTNNGGVMQRIPISTANINFSGLMSKADKRKLDDVADGANKITKLSELENDKTFKTEAEIQSMIEKASSLKKEVVTSLPQTGKDDVIYLVKDDKGKDNNNYLEYLWLNGKYELIGSTQVDLSGYAKQADIPTKLSQLQDDETHRTVTDLEKTKLSNIEDGANKVTKISQLENDKNFKTEEEVKSIVTSDMESYFSKMPKIVLLTSDEYSNLHEHEKETIYVIK